MSCPASRSPASKKKSLFDYAIPYWRRLTLVLALSLVSTAISLAVPYLVKDLVNRALLGRDWHALLVIMGLFLAITLAGFALNMVSGLRYIRVSAEILFDMRLALYRHLQQLSPRFFARTRMGEIMGRINNDIGEIQRIAAETALAWVGNVLFLAGSVIMLLYLDARLFALSIALVPASVWALSHYRRRLEGKVATLREASADIGNFLIETLQGATIAENLRYARPDASDRDLEDAASAAGIARFIAGLPLQYQTQVGERGTALSAGERQRIALARAFLADPAVLVLDEPTAALDPVSERTVIAGYEGVMKGRTTILITHRLELACQADRVIVLDGAAIAESGTPGELQAMPGTFARLFARAAVP